MRHMSFRFHTSNNAQEDKKGGEYEKSFQDLLGKSGASQKEKDYVEQQKVMKEKMVEEAQKKFQEDKASFEKQKQQEFEDLLSGKKKSKDEMNLQEIFKEFYGKAKEVSPTEYVNSAKSSLNSFSSLLERRRKQAQQV